jgi:MFS family permease
MSDEILPKQPLGVGALLSETFSIFFSNIVKVMILGFIAAALGLIINALFLGFDVAIGIAQPDTTELWILIASQLLSTLVGMAVYGLITAILVMLAYDVKLGRQNSIGSYIGAAVSALVPIVVLSIVVTILTGVGLIGLGIGGLWVFAVFYVVIPICVIEKRSFKSMSRSADLTKEYRWPIVGLTVIMAIVSVVMGVIAVFAVVALAYVFAEGIAAMIVLGLTFATLTGFGYGIPAIAVALTYARLREIKEGVDVDQIAAVFD